MVRIPCLGAIKPHPEPAAGVAIRNPLQGGQIEQSTTL